MISVVRARVPLVLHAQVLLHAQLDENSHQHDVDAFLRRVPFC